MEEIKEAQAPYVVETVPTQGPPPPSVKNTFRPLESEIGAGSTYTFSGPPIVGDEHADLNAALRAAGLFGVLPIDDAKRLRDAMNNPAAAPQEEEAAPQEEEEDSDPPSVREKNLRSKIEAYKRSDYDPSDPTIRDRLQRRGRAIWAMFNKPIEEFTETQLEAVWDVREAWF
jgi:hypothetical protein